jgi:hypothetical protein
MRYLFSLSFLLFLTPAFSQVSIDSFYAPGSHWLEMERESFGQGLGYNTYYSYQVQNDSTINNLNYHLLYSKTDIHCVGTGLASPMQCTAVSDPYTLLAAIRVDNWKVYVLNLGPDSLTVRGIKYKIPPGQEKILYDYDLQVGGTAGWKPAHQTVTSIDSVLVNGLYLRRYTFYDGGFPMADYWVEGIGSVNGVLGAYSYPSPGPSAHFVNTLCYERTGWVSYRLPTNLAGAVIASCSALNPPLGTDGPDAYQAGIFVYPNPIGDGKFRIKSANKIASISVYDIQGRNLSHQEYTGGEIILNGTAGTYNIKIVLQDGTVVSKLLQKQ